MDGADRLDGDFAGVVADAMQALATPGRVRVLGRLGRLERERTRGGGGDGILRAYPPAAAASPSWIRSWPPRGLPVVCDFYDDRAAHLLGEAISRVKHVQHGLMGRVPQRAIGV